jgi:hypothetical protein
MSAHKEDLLRRFPRIQPMILHLSSLTTKAFTIAVIEELVLLLLATAYYLADGPYALEIWTALFVAFSVHLVVHIGQGIIIRGYVPGLITSILLLPYSYYGISCICQEMNSGKLILLGVIGFVAIAVNLWFAHWLGKKFFSNEKRTSSSGNSPATIFLHNRSKSQKLLERD